ncbi:acyltransferase family protein [Micromonospora sp. GCM10011542]|uniref:acyltransferase family protein n=1 Tax=Micromonospora sp. GCM10011542 TaxID=3317337 RepID=UPI0036241706
MTSTTAAVAEARPERVAGRLPSLTGLRWIAALLVFGFHVATMGIIVEPDYRAVVDKVFALGLSGVEFFFILSGFVLVWSARDGERKRSFWRRRFAKIYPNHLVLWAAALLVALWFADPISPAVAVENLLLLQAWDARSGWFYSVNTVSWSLSCEFFFYLCLPLALPLLRRARPWALWAVVVAVPLLILALWPAQTLVPEVNRWWFAQIFPPVRSLEFWMGAAAAELMRRGWWRGPRLSVASVLFVVVWVAAAQWVRAELWAALLAAAYLLVITAAADADVRGGSSPWRSRPLIWLGEVSFAFYLVHVLVMTAVLRWSGNLGVGFTGWRGPAVVLGFLLLTLVLAGLLHRYVETPLMRRLAPRRGGAPPGGGIPRPRTGDDAAVTDAAVTDAVVTDAAVIDEAATVDDDAVDDGRRVRVDSR